MTIMVTTPMATTITGTMITGTTIKRTMITRMATATGMTITRPRTRTTSGPLRLGRLLLGPN